jgi:hypothetical protein
MFLEHHAKRTESLLFTNAKHFIFLQLKSKAGLAVTMFQWIWLMGRPNVRDRDKPLVSAIDRRGYPRLDYFYESRNLRRDTGPRRPTTVIVRRRATRHESRLAWAAARVPEDPRYPSKQVFARDWSRNRVGRPGWPVVWGRMVPFIGRVENAHDRPPNYLNSADEEESERGSFHESLESQYEFGDPEPNPRGGRRSHHVHWAAHRNHR